MPKVKFDPEKYSRNASAAAGDYAEGVQSPRRSQTEAAIAAEGNYEAGIQESISRKAYSKGLSKAGDEKWKKGVREKGRTRYQQGVVMAGDEYRKGFEPYRNVIESIDLGPRGPKGQNYDRVQKVGEALRAAKLSM